MAIKVQPTVTQFHVQELNVILDEVEHTLGVEKAQKLRQLLHSHQTLTQLIQNKNVSIDRLRRLLFGGHTERTREAVDGRGELPVEGTKETVPPDQ